MSQNKSKDNLNKISKDLASDSEDDPVNIGTTSTTQEKIDKDNTGNSNDRKSPVWLYFKKIEDSKTKKFETRCTIDKCTDSYAYNGSTTSMLRHLKAEHKKAYDHCISFSEKPSIAKQSKLTSSDYKIQTLTKERTNTITRAIGKFLAFDMKAINTIEGSGFQGLLEVLEPRYVIPCRKTFTESVIQGLYESMKKDLLSELKQPNFYGLTFDYWQSLALKSYLTLSLHFCSEAFEIQNYVLRTVEVPQSHTGLRTANVIQSILEDFNLNLNNPTLRLVSVSDAASNMAASVAELKLPHVFCFAHLLHNCLKHAFQAPELKKIFGKVKELVLYFRSSPQKSDKLISMQKTLQLPEIKLKKSVETRWSSQYDSIDRLLQCRQAVINIGLNDIEVAVLTLSLEEWEDLIQIREILKPFTFIIDVLQTAQRPSISMIKPLIFNIITHILKITKEDNDYVVTIKHLILEDFLDRIKNYEAIKDLLLLTSIIDPRFKNMYYLEEKEKLEAENF